MSAEGAVAVSRVELRRVGAADLVRHDEELSRCELVRSVSAGSLDQLLQGAVGKRFVNHASVFREGDGCTALYLVLRGEVRLLGRAGTEQVDFGGACRGELFGEDAVDARARPYSAVAFGGDADVLEVPAQALREVLSVEGGLRTLVAGLRSRRDAARKEMCDFLGRW